MCNNKIIKPEILSPSGDYESLCAAVRFGADAIFLAGKSFGMRTASKNFDNGELKRATELAHANNVKIYVTCNTLPRNDEFADLPEFLMYCQDIGVDAFIIADLGVFSYAKKYAPNVARHISTQAGIVNYETANYFYNEGAERVVLARELPLDQIATIRAKTPRELQIECFVHGAMCVSFSGRCLISSYMTGRDANRGDCCQPCRWKYHLYEENREGQFFPVEENENGTFLYNSRDLCMIEHIPELVNAGISSFKIEGRAKSAYYTAVTTNAYRQAVDLYSKSPDNFILPQWIKDELDKISHREYNTGFYFGTQPGQVTKNGGYIRHYDVVAMCEGKQDDKIVITQRNRFFVGDELDVLPPSGISYKIKVEALQTEYGELVENAPHPMQKLFLTTNADIPQGSYLRKKNDK